MAALRSKIVPIYLIGADSLIVNSNFIKSYGTGLKGLVASDVNSLIGRHGDGTTRQCLTEPRWTHPVNIHGLET